LKLHTVYVVMLIWTPSFVSIIPPSNGAVRSMSTCMPIWKVQEFKSRLSFPAVVLFSITAMSLPVCYIIGPHIGKSMFH